MLEIKNISSGYGKKQVLFDVSLQVKAGEVVLLTGGNGSGKSTLLKCIYNLLPLWSGEILFCGKRTDGLKPFDLIHKGIVYIPQKDFCFENLTVEENLQIAGTIYPLTELNSRIAMVYDQTGLGPLKKRKPSNLSGGEKKLLAFGMGLIHNPILLLFDEPLAGLDAENSNKLMFLLDKCIFSKKTSSIFIEHRVPENDFFSRNIPLELGRLKTRDNEQIN